MSIDNNSECVRSKYFSGQSAMDESLSDFQESKKSCRGPKPAHKPTKPKTRKVSKRIKGQKDIRTALKGKKNELLSYSKEFDTVCKKSGLDVDSEQLQLAIALSKSLQTQSTSDPETSQALSSQQRVAKIRKTLQEYGFKVPEAKIVINKRTKKVRNNYKLLTISEEEKHQIITKKYSQIIFGNLDNSRLDEINSVNHDVNTRVFYIATNIPYESMKDDNVFYVEGLIEKSTTSGSLLRDWSAIPGRPESPKLINTETMDFKDIDCSQDELDVVLSGSFESVKSIIATKEIKYKNKCTECGVPKIVVDDERASVGGEIRNSQDRTPLQIKTPVKNKFAIKTSVKVPSHSKKIPIISPIKEVSVNHTLFEDVIGVESNDKLTTPTQQYRSCSPDIFDDDFSSILDNTKPITVLSQENKTKLFNEDNFMDLTRCANSQNKDNSQLSQNVTKRKSIDFMEVTECIVSSSQPIREKLEEIDLTQTPEDIAIITEENQNQINVSNNENIDLSTTNDLQSTNVCTSQNIVENNEIVFINHPENTGSDKITNDNNIDLTQSSNEDDRRITVVEKNNHSPNTQFDNMDLTQSSNSTDIDDLPLVNIANSQTQKSLDDTIIINEEYIANGKIKSIVFEKETCNVFDLYQAQNDSKEYKSTSVEKSKESCNASFYEDFVHDHSENTKYTENSEHNSINKESNDIDLTQESDTSEEQTISPRPDTTFKNIPNNSSLGKRDDVSIDYDEILIDDDNINDKGSEKSNNINLKCNLSRTNSHNNDIEIVHANDADINSSQNSEAFNISDKELDYSLHKSRYEFPRDNFEFGGISVLDNECTGMDTNKNTENSFLPEINMKDLEKFRHTLLIHTTENPTPSSPIKVHEVLNSNNGIVNIKTPKNTEYVIKMDDVTPMADYKSMSTPQRNRELDKYGLKPFKRKRAIQILTHLYNQTHPTIQQLVDEDQPSPSKKPRQELNTRTRQQEHSSPKRSRNSPKPSPTKTPEKSCRKTLLKWNKADVYTSPRKTEQLEREKGILCMLSPKKTEELKRDSDQSSEPSPKKTERVKDVYCYEVTNEVATIKSVDCNPNDWVFQKREKAKVHSCRVPLHIAFHNYVLSRRSLREAILKYESVNIDVIHKDLVGYGHRYDPKDLLSFLDKKCITVKTTDNNSRNNKR